MSERDRKVAAQRVAVNGGTPPWDPFEKPRNDEDDAAWKALEEARHEIEQAAGDGTLAVAWRAPEAGNVLWLTPDRWRALDAALGLRWERDYKTRNWRQHREEWGHLGYLVQEDEFEAWRTASHKDRAEPSPNLPPDPLTALVDRMAATYAAIPATHRPNAPQARKRGRSYREDDLPLVEEMERLIASGRARGPEDAARAVVARAVGSGTDESKIKRLAGACGRRGKSE
jgi:hypothetical protein